MELQKIVEKLNSGLVDESMFVFGLIETPYWDSICIFYMGISIPIWDSENGPSEPSYSEVLGKFQKVVLELFKISQIGKVVQQSLSHLYTDLLMLEDETWSPDEDSIACSLRNLEEVAEDILELELKDTRKNE